MKIYPFICEKCAADLTDKALRIHTGASYKYFCSKKCVGDYLADRAAVEIFEFCDYLKERGKDEHSLV